MRSVRALIIRGLPVAGITAAIMSTSGMSTAAKAVKQTKSSSQVIQTRDGIVIRVAAGSEYRKMPPTDLQIHPGAKTRSIPIRLKSGRVDLFVPEVGKKIPRLTVQGDVVSGKAKASIPVAAVVTCSRDRMAIVESGWTTVMIDDGNVIVANHRGRARLGTLRTIRDVREGFVSVLGADPRANEVVKLPGQPSFLPSDRVLISRSGKPVQVPTIAWKPVPNATAYLVKITSPLKRRFRKELRVTVPNLGSWKQELEPGAYQVAVRAMDKFGFTSEGEATTQLRVASLGLPLGGYIDEKNRIWIRPGQHILLSNTEGLLMSFSNGAQWSRASRDIGLYHNQFRTVLIKHPGDTRATKLEIRAINVVADVTMQPMEPVWPGPPIMVDVQVHTTDGQPLPKNITPFAQATLANRPLTVRWHRHGSHLHAVIPSRSLPGPRVLRVEVSDQFGLPLGRNFVEITAKR